MDQGPNIYVVLQFNSVIEPFLVWLRRQNLLISFSMHNDMIDTSKQLKITHAKSQGSQNHIGPWVPLGLNPALSLTSKYIDTH